MIEIGQSNEDELDESTLAEMSALDGGFMGNLMVVTGWCFGQLLLQAMLQNRKDVVAAGYRGHTKIQQQIKTCHESQHVANALG